MANMRRLMELADAIRVVYAAGIEFEPECFVPLAGAKLEAYRCQFGPTTEPMYEVVALEPGVVERDGNDKLTLELAIVSERDRKLMLDAVKFVYAASREMPEKKEQIQFADRLEWLRPKLPGVITGPSAP